MNRSFLSQALFYIGATTIVVYALFPFVWAGFSSLRSEGGGIFLPGLQSFLGPLTIKNYVTVLKDPRMLSSCINSIIVAVGTVSLSLLLGSLCAYALSRLPFRFKQPVLFITLAMMIFPQVSLLTGLFFLLQITGLYYTRSGLTLTYLVYALPLTVLLLRGYFRSLPAELEEAAYIDGAGPLTVFWKILLPLSAPGLFTTTMLTFIGAWNEFLFALTFTTSDQARTLPVTISTFGGRSYHETPWGQILAASLLVSLPLLLFVAVFQSRIMAGISAGAIRE
jgi:trehalose/maltose transport system permease protein